jgi:hypothetical protein
MAIATKLCSTCTNIFQLKDGEKSSISKPIEAYHPHHSTLQSLRDAVSNGCFICTKAWSFFGKQTQMSWINDPGSWTPLNYNLAMLQTTIMLSIRWSSPFHIASTPAKFHLLPTSTSGLLCPISDVLMWALRCNASSDS